MNPFVFVVLGGLSAWAAMQPPAVVMGPAQAPSPNAGRVVALEELGRIADTGDGYFLTNPSALQLAPDGSLFVLDVNKIVRFDRAGRFVRSYKPGASSGSFMFAGLGLTGDSVVAFERVGQRVYIFDLATGTERGFRVQGEGPTRNQFLVAQGGRLYFSDGRRVFSYSMAGRLEGPEVALTTDETSEEDGAARRVLTASVRATALGTTEAIVCSSFDYRLRRVDLAAGRVTTTFGRQYSSVRNENESTRRLAPSKLDIGTVYVVDGWLWVFTSTHDPKKGTLVDVFDLDGRYVDSFYLQVKDGDDAVSLSFGPKAIAGGELHVIRRKAEAALIERYRIRQ